MLATLWSDVRYSVRTLARSPAFAAAAIVTIALGVGVNTGIFTILNGVLFRGLPAPDAHELVAISQTVEGAPDRGGWGFSTAEHRIYDESTQTFTGIAGHSDPTATTLGGESPQEMRGTIVTCNYFDVLEQPPVLGRGLTRADCETGADAVVVLAHDLWTETFAADPQIVGRTVELNRQLFTVVGVAREGTYSGLGLYPTSYFAPISTQPLLLPNENTYANDLAGWLALLGRRSGGLDQVRAELAVIAARIDQLEPGRSTTVSADRATPLGNVGFFRNAALAISGVIMTAFALVLLIACANVANLLLARATTRSREIAVRLSLGATRSRVIRQLLTESVLISIAGGALGSVLALWSFQVLIAFAMPAVLPPGVPPLLLDASPDFRVLAFTLVLTFGTGIVFGLAPALTASRLDLHTVIKQDTAGAGSRKSGRLQRTLIAVQVATCMVLMIAAGLLLRGLNATQTVDPGFDYGNVVVASYDLRGGGYDPAEAAVFQRRLLEEAQALPGVEAAALAVLEPLVVDAETSPVRLPSQDASAFRNISLNGVTPGYFDLLRIPIVRGRAFAETDMTDASTAVIVTESTARNFWPGQDPIGQKLSMAVGPGQEIALDVIGVSRDAEITAVGQAPAYYLFLPAAPRAAQLLKLLVKSRADFATTAEGIRAAVRALDDGLAVRVSPLEANLDYFRSLSGVLTALAATLGVLALVLAAVGINGVVAYFVGQRTHEIGIRMALGARAGDVLRLVLERTMRPVVIGAGLGIAAGAAVSNVLSSVLFGVSPFDPIGIGGAVLFVLAIACAAGILPGRRAARTQPTTALHYD